MKRLSLIALLCFSARVTVSAQATKEKDSKPNYAMTTKVSVKTENCEEIDWKKHRDFFTKMKASGTRKFTFEIQHEGLTKKELPAVTTFSVTGRNPTKVLKRAKKWCGQILSVVP